MRVQKKKKNQFVKPKPLVNIKINVNFDPGF